MNKVVTGTKVTVPHLAETLVSAVVSKWLVQPGDRVEQYDAICELLTDKVNTEMPSPVAGTVVKLLVNEGDEAKVGETICIIDEGEETSAQGVHFSSVDVTQNSKASGATQSPREDGSMRSRLSPVVQRLAAEHNVDLNDVQGTGLGGRITRKDILNHVANEPPAKVEGKPAKPAEPPVRTTGLHLSEEPRIPTVEVEGESGDHLIDITPIRNTIATKMRQSVSEIPHAWTMIEIDVTNLVQVRSKLKDEFYRQEGINLTYLAFLMKAVVNAIKDYPIMNSVWAVDKIIVKRDINISLAVGTEDSVLTPVIKKADQKNIAGLAREIDELAKKTRAGKLTPDDMQGGTFTVNNTGSFGSVLSYPIINYPQAAILTFESIVKRPVVIDDMIAVRSMVNVCLSLDHRILDGVICGRFLQRIKENLESYNLDTKLY